MLLPAILVKNELEELYKTTWFDDRYMYFHNGVYADNLQISDNTYKCHQFASIYNGNVIGYIGYAVSRPDDAVAGIAAIHFMDTPYSNSSIVFGVDLYHALRDIFEKYKFRKISFTVTRGNPIEKSYDKLIKKYGGRIVGVYHKDVRLTDGEYHDQKIYEIMAEDYFCSVLLSRKNRKM